jgi:hypothetical protein
VPEKHAGIFGAIEELDKEWFSEQKDECPKKVKVGKVKLNGLVYLAHLIFKLGFMHT